MHPAPLVDTLATLLAIGLVISMGTLVTFLVMHALDDRRTKLPRATARPRS